MDRTVFATNELEQYNNRKVANWIFVGVLMLIVQVVLGGVTRLTGSGLSITEWKPIMGAMPPMGEAAWQKAFEQYQQIAQFKYINSHFSLQDFKFIFFWEWFHRLWARLIGVAFLIPFVYFLYKGFIKNWMIRPLLILFVLGGLQGAIGWIMVQSGLNDTDVYVSHIRLSIHFISAMVLICYALVFGLMLRVPEEARVLQPKFKQTTIALVALLTIQLFYGAFMAGLKAATAAPTWPSINGHMLPESWGNIFHDRITIHFIHRTLAYLVLIVVIGWWLKAKALGGSSWFAKAKNWPLLLVVAQVLLGIFSLLTSYKIVPGSFGLFEWMAQLHQIVGMLLLLSLVTNVYLLRYK